MLLPSIVKDDALESKGIWYLNAVKSAKESGNTQFSYYTTPVLPRFDWPGCSSATEYNFVIPRHSLGIAHEPRSFAFLAGQIGC